MSIRVGSLSGLEATADSARNALRDKNAAREQALARSREVVRFSANAIRAIHRRDFDRASQLIGDARLALETAVTSVASHGDVRHAGFVADAQKEFAEANIVFALLTGQVLPGPNDVGVEVASYLNGLGEAVGELRRFLLDGLRQNDLTLGESLLSAMDDIYSALVTVDFPDAITGGLRRTTDMVRGILEKTRGDLTVAMRQDELERQIHALELSLDRKLASD